VLFFGLGCWDLRTKAGGRAAVVADVGMVKTALGAV